MAYDFEQTHERIMKSAVALFRERGFSGASIRQICKDAGVTNGAFYAHFESKEDLFEKLVEPVLEGMRQLYDTENEHYMDIRSAEEANAVLKQTFSSNTLLIRYLYENAGIFLLLLSAGAGTRYENYCEKLAEYEIDNTMAFLEKCRPFVKHPENITAGVVKRMSFFAVSAVFDSFANGMPEEETVRESHLASAFCIAGMKEVIGL
ncbi:MAG: TetR/AcrR family transcriptional regulator [Lachnospiraceae bacterium]|nr:TetR/AcrR family transcriptional regulator [Lachnospiraceae bacterium]